jgi:fructokinase
MVCTAGETVDVPGAAIQVADTVGAGDAFTAAFISGMLRGWNLNEIARFANQAGALVASRKGAMPDVRRDLHKLIKRAHQPGGS